MGIPRQISIAPAAAAANNISASQSPGAGAILINGSAATGGVATLDIARRVVLTSGGNDSGITFTVVGTNRFGAVLTENVTGGNAVASSPTTQDFKTITSITHTGSVAGTLTVGTTGTATSASSEWIMADRSVTPQHYGIAVVVTGTINYTVEYTYDDPASPFTATFPTVFSITSGALTAKAANGEAGSTFNFPVTALRLTINSYSTNATIKMIVAQAGSFN